MCAPVLEDGGRVEERGEVRCCRSVRAGMTKEVRRKRGKDRYLISGKRHTVIDRLVERGR